MVECTHTSQFKRDLLHFNIGPTLRGQTASRSLLHASSSQLLRVSLLLVANPSLASSFSGLLHDYTMGTGYLSLVGLVGLNERKGD